MSIVNMFTCYNNLKQVCHWGYIMNYIKRMRDLREDHDKTQQEIADILGTSQTMYARYERGANELPIRHLITLCEYYSVSTDYLLCLTDEMSQQKNTTR